LLYCGDGKRAAKALQLMRELSFREVYTIRGGLDAWKRKRYPTEPVPAPPKK
jgi:rhodanese-related sulfurtransferase